MNSNNVTFCRQCLYGDSHPLGLTINEDGLCSGCIIHEEKNYLESMDGSIFNLPQNINASKLTDEVVKLIGGMYYGSSEVRELINN